MKDLVRFLAAWALVHESADEAWRAAVARGERLAPVSLDQGPEAVADGLAALVAEEKERLKRRLLEGDAGAAGATDLGPALEALRFEVAELRGRIETPQASLDAVAARLEG